MKPAVTGFAGWRGEINSGDVVKRREMMMTKGGPSRRRGRRASIGLGAGVLCQTRKVLLLEAGRGAKEVDGRSEKLGSSMEPVVDDSWAEGELGFGEERQKQKAATGQAEVQMRGGLRCPASVQCRAVGHWSSGLWRRDSWRYMHACSSVAWKRGTRCVPRGWVRDQGETMSRDREHVVWRAVGAHSISGEL